MSTTNEEAAAALEAMRESRARLAAAANCPPERHLAFAGLLGALVASQAASPFFTLGIEGLVFIGIALVVLWDRRRTGMFINGYRAGRTQRVTFSLLAFALICLGLGIWLKLAYGLVWAPVALGVVVAIVAYVGSSVWQRIYLRELAETP